MSDFVDPSQILSRLNLRSDMTAADFGSGSGGWTIPLAKILNKGRVFAVDILEEPLSALMGRARHEGVVNITKVLADVEKEIVQISPLSCDLVLMNNILFQVDDPRAVFSQAFRVLKPEGMVLVVDWKEDAPFVPQGNILGEEKIKEIAKEAGFTLKDEFSAGQYHFALLFEKH